MSHYSRVKTEFHNREALIACLKNLGHEVVTNTVIKGHHGEHAVDIAVTGTRGYGIGFVRGADGTYDMVADWWGVSGTSEQKIAQDLKSQADHIQRAYARKMVLDQAASDGFEVISQSEDEDGTLRIVVRRWE